MKVGIKTHDVGDFLKNLEKNIDFFEVMAVQEKDYSFAKNISVPIVIHAEHQGFGVNPADSTKKEKNLKSINFAKKFADSVNATKIIVHPGEIEKGNKNCSIKNAINFFKEINDGRILVENLPKYQNSENKSLCRTPHQIKQFMKKTNVKFCFDINHAMECMEKFEGKNYNFIKKYIKLNPAHYHIGGHNFKEMKSHLSLLNSDLDLKKVLKFYPEDAEISLEVAVYLKKETDALELEKEVRIIKKAISELGK
jgi:endonuclease IV